MIGAYRVVLASPGALAFTCAGLASRLPMSMITLSTLMLVHRETGSFALAAAVTAVSGLAGTITGPLLAREVDRRGQAVVLRPTVVLHAAAVSTLVALCVGGAPRWSWFVAAAISGATCPAAGTLIRARWAHLLDCPERLQTAFAWESTVDEMLYLIGPALVAICAATVSPALALLLGMLSTVVGCFCLAAQSRTAPRPAASWTPAAGGRALTRPVVLIGAVLALLGALCGSISVLITADTRALGFPALAGPALSLWALGSLAAGLAYGSIRWQLPLARRFVLGLALLSVGTVPVAFATTPWALALAMVGAGVTISPVFITAYALVAQLVPADVRTQGMTWISTGMGVTGAAGGAAAGILIEWLGAHQAFLVGVSAGPAALLVALAGYRTLWGPVPTHAAIPLQRRTEGPVAIAA